MENPCAGPVRLIGAIGLDDDDEKVLEVYERLPQIYISTTKATLHLHFIFECYLTNDAVVCSIPEIVSEQQLDLSFITSEMKNIDRDGKTHSR